MVMVIVMMEVLSIVVHIVAKMPETPHLGAAVMAHVVSRRALPMAFHDVLHCCTFRFDVGHWAWTTVVAHVVSMLTLLMALHCFLHLARQLWTLGLWALGVARGGAMRMMTILVADPNWLERLAFLLELCPWARACFVASHIPTACLVARLDFLHFLLHCLMEMFTMVIFVLLAVVVPPPAMLNFVILFLGVRMVTIMIGPMNIVVLFVMKMPEGFHLGAGVMAQVVSRCALPMACDVGPHFCAL